jgi:hypothetical protein
VHERWARLRFSVIGALLAAPPAKGALRAALKQGFLYAKVRNATSDVTELSWDHSVRPVSEPSF